MPDIQPAKLGNGGFGLTRVGPDGSGTIIVGIQSDTPSGAINQLTGELAYKELARKAGPTRTKPWNDQAASEHLRDLGIPGIKYFDGNSRAAGEGTRNYVVFDEDDLTILKRNNERLADMVGD